MVKHTIDSVAHYTMLWLVVIICMFSTTNSKLTIPSAEEIHLTYLRNFMDNFDRRSLYPQDPIFDRQDFKGFPMIETTFGEDQLFYQCGPKDMQIVAVTSSQPHSHIHCSKCMKAMRSYKKTYTHQGPFVLSYKFTKINHVLENARCSFYI